MIHHRLRVFAAIAIIAMFAGQLPAATTAPATAPATQPVTITIDREVRDLVPLIQKGEAIFDDAELAFTYNYRLLGKPQSPQTIEAMEETTTLVVQWPGVYRQTETVYGLNGESSSQMESIWDGSFWCLTDGKDAAITDQCVWDRAAHSLPGPFIYLVGDGASSLSKVFQTGLAQDAQCSQHFQRIPDADYLGRRCIRVVATITGSFPVRSTGPRRYTWWLCPDAAYLPLKLELHATSDDGERTVFVMEASDLREVASDIMLPFKATATLGDVKAGTFREWTIDRIALHPKHPPEKFTELALPRGMVLSAMHERKAIKKGPINDTWNLAAARELLRSVQSTTAPTTRVAQ